MKRESQLANQITEGIIWKQLLIFFFPIVFGTFFQHAHFETLHEAAGLAGFASALCDLTFIRGWAAVLYVTYSREFEGKRPSEW